MRSRGRAHDFRPEWFRAASPRRKKGTEGDLLLAVDGARVFTDVRGRSPGSRWCQRAGRSQRLDRNYRNTREVLELA
jgi:hypothetical protein